MRAEAERAQLARTAADLRASLDEATGRVSALQRQVDERERELESAERAATASTVRMAPSPAAERERRALRDKIDELQAHIRERNEERAELRRQLADATEGKTGAPTAVPPPGQRVLGDADEDMEALPDRTGIRPVLLPRFGQTATAAFETIPRNVAANAMHTIGALAAGDAAAWRAVKQAMDMSRQVLMTRIGIHHRLVFRADEGALEILDLVPRESLLMVLKRLRSA
jgi:hypothetical protein